MTKRVLLTGHTGYLGSLMGPMLLQAGYDAVGLDVGYFADCTLPIDFQTIPGQRKDIRDIGPQDLEGFDAVIHLAALSNDPIGNLNDGWTAEINHEGSVKLAQLAKQAGVERFLFSSSCIMYGLSEAAVCNEDSPLAPQTEYARSKVRSEEAIRAMADATFSPTFMRNGTVYGISLRMRLDTVLNDLVSKALVTGKVVVMGDGKPWRPVVHIEDLCRSFIHVLGAPREKVHNQAFNNGADHLNHQIIDLANIVVETVPGATLEVQGSKAVDQRTYKADFAKFAATFPEFQFKWTPRTGAAELYEGYKRAGLSQADLDGPRYVRLRWLHKLLEESRLDGNLRWASK